MSTLIVPLNGSLTLYSSVDADGWSAEQLGLGGRELVVGQGALLVQGGELIQLIEQGRPGCRWRGWGRWRGRGGRLLLLEVVDARALVILRLCLLLRSPAQSPARDVCGTAYRGRAQQRASSSHDHDNLLGVRSVDEVKVLLPFRQGQAEGDHELRCCRHDLGAADLRRDGVQHAQQVCRRGPGIQRVSHLPEIRGRRRVECDENGDLDEGEATRVQAALHLPLLAHLQAFQQKLRVAESKACQRFPGGVVDVSLGGHIHDRIPSVAPQGGSYMGGPHLGGPPESLLRLPECRASPAADGSFSFFRCRVPGVGGLKPAVGRGRWWSTAASWALGERLDRRVPGGRGHAR